MSKIIDNDAVLLADALSEVLPHADRLDACVGYFNLRGWQSIAEAVKGIVPAQPGQPAVRLLVGMATHAEQELRDELKKVWGQQQEDSMSIELAVKLAEQSVDGFARQLTWGFPTKKDFVGLKRLVEDLKSGFLEVRFFAKHLLHAKLYVTHFGSGGLKTWRGVVGSSNWTNAGMKTQGELNLEETDEQLAKELADWFEARWDDVFTILVNELLIEAIETTFAASEQPEPRLIHLKMAYELSHEARLGLASEIAPQFVNELLEYQESAVKVALKMLEQRGLVVIGDVVGLGKTMVGSAIAASSSGSTLVICPKNLTKMWEGYFEKYHIPGRVLSLSTVIKELPEMRHYATVIVDESHRLRNRKSKSWEAVRDYIERGNSRVVLMTATMFNAYHHDISGQLGLKLSTDESLGVRPEKLIESLGELDVAKKTNGSLDTLAAFDQSEFNEDWQQLLGLFLIRRTRKFVENNFGIFDEEHQRYVMKYPNGAEYSFPKRVPEPLDYPGGPNDPGDRLASVENFDKMYELNYARYRLGAYLKAEVTAHGSPESEVIEDLKKSVNSHSGFIRTTALKRLTSSAQAFLLTLERMLFRAYVLEHAITNGLPIPVGSLSNSAYDVAEELDEDLENDEFVGVTNTEAPEVSNGFAGRLLTREEWLTRASAAYEALAHKQPKGLRWALPEWFNYESLLSDLQGDSEVMQSIIDEHGDWDPKHDTKLAALAELIQQLPEGKKALVFTEYKDTVDYLALHLSTLTSGKNIEAASGKSASPEVLARRFSPKSNEALGGLPQGETELDVLLSTDVLSEGQNLQDADLVINWDLPWTIIKVIQRAGRVDRVGQKSPTIRVMSFRPQEGVENLIQLRSRLAGRLKDNAEIFGAGEKFFDDDGVVDDDAIAGLFNGTQRLDLDEGDVDYPSFALEIWKSASVDEQSAARRLRDSSFSTKEANELHPRGTLGYFETHLGYHVLVSKQGETTKTMNPINALKATATDPGVSALEPDEAFFDDLEAIVKNAFSEKAHENHLVVHKGIRKRLYDALLFAYDKGDLDQHRRVAVKELIDEMVESPILDSAMEFVLTVLRESKNFRQNLDFLDALLDRHSDKKLVKKTSGTGNTSRLFCAMGFR